MQNNEASAGSETPQEKSATQLKKEAKNKEKDEKFKAKLEKQAAQAALAASKEKSAPAKIAKPEEKKQEIKTYTSHTKLGEKKGGYFCHHFKSYLGLGFLSTKSRQSRRIDELVDKNPNHIVIHFGKFLSKLVYLNRHHLSIARRL